MAEDQDQQSEDEKWMRLALQLADKAAAIGEVPVGAVVVLDGEVIGQGWNQPISRRDPTAHAEIIALRDAAQRIENYRLVDADLYVTLEPCSMCAGASVHSRIRRLVYGATEPKAGVIESQQQFLEEGWLNHRVEPIGGVLAEICSDKLSAFFKARRAAHKAAKAQRKLEASQSGGDIV